jgi:hypothetical protein
MMAGNPTKIRNRQCIIINVIQIAGTEKSRLNATGFNMMFNDASPDLSAGHYRPETR